MIDIGEAPGVPDLPVVEARGVPRRHADEDSGAPRPHVVDLLGAAGESDAPALRLLEADETPALMRVLATMNLHVAVAIITVASVLLSLVVLMVEASITQPSTREFLRSLGLSIGTPLLVAPAVTYPMFRMARKLEQMRLLACELSVRDALTGIFNRRYFHGQIERAFARARRDGTPLSVVMIDVDRFKAINDHYGHGAGDTVLRHIATVCGERLRESDVLARYGGEEFVALLPQTRAEMALALGDTLRASVESAPAGLPDGERIGATISVGVADLRLTDRSTAAFLARADRALYAAKTGGRNRVCLAAA